MSLPTPDKLWWTTTEIASAGLPDMPKSRQGVEKLATDWRRHDQFARRRDGRGGGWEYHWSLLPDRAKQRLTLAAMVAAPEAKAPVRMGRDEAWAWFESLPQAVKDKASSRLALIQQVEALEVIQSGGRHVAIVDAARNHGQGVRTVWGWFGLIDGVAEHDRLPYLAPRHRATAQVPRPKKDCDPAFFDMIKSDFLRPAAPPFSDCYRRAMRVALKQGLETLPERTMRRRLDQAVSEVSQILARKGLDAVKRAYPSQVRDKTSLVAMQAVNADFHKFDIFVAWPAPKGEASVIGRPQMVAFQDIYSGRILSWRIDVTPNSTAVMLCAGDMIETWGIPEHVTLDNGREFAAKAITGGTSTRYRFKVKDDDIPGLFTGLGSKIHWATPYSGQSKPIERAFRDMCSAIAKDPRFDGAYTGNRPDAKPEDYGSRAVPLEAFLKVLAEGIEEHNTRQGRRSEVAWGRSFAEVFDESYSSAPIRKATEAQRRFWLMGAEGLRAAKLSGEITFQGNRFWEHWMQDIAGERVIIRFDPAALWDGIHIYSAENAYLGFAPCLAKVGFYDMDEARIHARARTTWLKAEKAALAAHRRYTAADYGALLDGAAPEATPPTVEAKVVRGAFGKKDAVPEPRRIAGSTPMPVADLAQAQAALVIDLQVARAPKPADEEPKDRYRRALELERAIAANQPVTREQERWLQIYAQGSEYRSMADLYVDFGDALFG